MNATAPEHPFQVDVAALASKACFAGTATSACEFLHRAAQRSRDCPIWMIARCGPAMNQGFPDEGHIQFAFVSHFTEGEPALAANFVISFRKPAPTMNRPKILLVCTANICRSPMAEGSLRRACVEANLEFDVDSAATHDYMVGSTPFPLAVAVAKQRGCDIAGSVARKVRPHDFRYFDLILAMDRDNLAALKAEAPRRYWHKIRLLLDYGSWYRGCGVRDPYGADVFAFERAFDMIEDGCRGLVRSYRDKRQPSPA